MSTTTPTAIVNYISYLFFGLIILAIAAVIFTTLIDPIVSDENSLLAFIVWMLGALFLASRFK